MQLTLMTATELAAAIRSKEISSTEWVESYLDRVDALNPGLGAVVTVAAESARSEAREADRCLARGEDLGPMHGLPVTVKDCLETAGMRTTCGARELAGYVPDNDAVASGGCDGRGPSSSARRTWRKRPGGAWSCPRPRLATFGRGD
jgi:amidase